MEYKLTLSIKEQVVKEAKAYAKAEGRSLSSLVEEYFKSLTASADSNKEAEPLHPLVSMLMGSVHVPDANQEYRSLLEDALLEKYLK